MIKVHAHYREGKFVRAHNRKLSEPQIRGKKNRSKGLRFEFVALAKAKKTHDIAIRSAGSHSSFDLFLEEPDKMRYQIVKANSYVPPVERRVLEKYMKTKPRVVQIELIYRKHKKDLSKFVMSPAGSNKLTYLDRTKLPKKSFSSTPNVSVLMDMVP